MKKRFVYTQKAWIMILSGLAMILAIICVVFNILRLCEVGKLISYNHQLDIIATIIMILVSLILVAFVVGSGYNFTKKSFVSNLGFFFKIVKYTDILLVREDNAKTMLFIYYKADKKAMIDDEKSGFRANYFQVYVDSKYFENIVDGLKKANRAIVYEIFGGDKEIKDERDSSK